MILVYEHTLTDFTNWESDRLHIRVQGFGGGLTQGVLDSDQFVLGTTANDANDRFIYNQASGALSFDADGSGIRGAVQIATLTNAASLNHDDFMLI